MSTRRRATTFVASAFIVVALAISAWAYITGNGIGAGNAATDTLASPTVTASSPSNGDAHISWMAVHSPANTAGENAEVTYGVERATNSSGPWASANNSCSGTLASSTLACDDLPSSGGTYFYRVTAHFRSWSSSGISNSVVVVTDSTPPTATISFPANNGSYKASAYAGGCSTVGICGSATDASGVASLRVSIKRGSDNTYWNGSSFSGTTETFNAATLGSPNAGSTGWGYAFALPADGSYTVHVQATDTFGNAQSGTTYAATSTFKIDTVAPTNALSLGASPTGAFLNGSTLYYKSDAAGSFKLVNSVSDTTSGPASATFPLLSGTNWTTHAAETVSTPAGGPFTSSLYQWSASAGVPSTTAFTATDNAANTNTGTSLTFTPDATGPSGTITSPGAGNVSGTVSLQSTTATDSASGVASVAYYYCSGTCTTSPPGAGWTLIGTGTSGPSWTTSWDASAVANGSYTLKAVLTDNVGNQTATAAVAVSNVSYTFSIGTVGTQTAGTAFGGITVQLQKNGSNIGTYLGSSYAGSHTITLGGTAWANAPDGTQPIPLSSTISLSFDATGQATVPASALTLFKAATGVNLVLSDASNSVGGTSNSFNVNAAAQAGIILTDVSVTPSGVTIPCSGSVGNITCAGTYTGTTGPVVTATVTLADQYQNAVTNTGSAITIDLSPSSGSPKFTTSSVTIANGQSKSGSLTFQAQGGSSKTSTGTATVHGTTQKVTITVHN